MYADRKQIADALAMVEKLGANDRINAASFDFMLDGADYDTGELEALKYTMRKIKLSHITLVSTLLRKSVLTLEEAVDVLHQF